ncbi:MAG TPA: hypothetical protein VEV84_06110, partial [Pyrinomonadaceae bacterium]|nr:hypothetical protein [Pyrinomonadaceae bacterium]
MRLPIPAKFLIGKALSLAILCSFLLSNTAFAAVLASDSRATTTNSSTLTTDLTQLGRDGRLRENPNFESEMFRLIGVLEKGEKRQPVIVDEKGESQDIVVEQVALKIATGEVSDALKGKSIVKLEDATLFSNARSEADAAKQIGEIIARAKQSKGKTILFINNLTSILNIAPAVDELTSAIANGELTVIGGCNSVQYAETIEKSPKFSKLFQAITVDVTARNSAKTEAGKSEDSEDYKGDNVSPDIREMMAKDPTGNTRLDVILQAKDANSPALRSILANGSAHIANRLGNTDTLVVNLPLSTILTLSNSGTINYVSPDRETHATGFIEETTGTSLARLQPQGTLDGTGVGVAVLDSGLYYAHNGFKNASGAS